MRGFSLPIYGVFNIRNAFNLIQFIHRFIPIPIEREQLIEYTFFQVNINKMNFISISYLYMNVWRRFHCVRSLFQNIWISNGKKAKLPWKRSTVYKLNKGKQLFIVYKPTWRMQTKWIEHIPIKSSACHMKIDRMGGKSSSKRYQFVTNRTQ